ncbi:hypothetical protein ACVWZZ_005952 [Bradyrhizobium sp. LM6.10]
MQKNYAIEPPICLEDLCGFTSDKLHDPDETIGVTLFIRGPGTKERVSFVGGGQISVEQFLF